MAENESGAEDQVTYGVGPAHKKKNVGYDVNQVSILDEKGRAWANGEVIVDPQDETGGAEVQQEDNEPGGDGLDLAPYEHTEDVDADARKGTSRKSDKK